MSVQAGGPVANAPHGVQPIPKKSQQIKTDKPRPHVCSVCTRGFARLEHLKRHERSHTNEKPFQCAACGRCFARRDLVLRHQQKLHAGLVIRGGGKDDNEHVIILDDNTSASAPLPNTNVFQDRDSSSSSSSSSNSDSTHQSQNSNKNQNQNSNYSHNLSKGNMNNDEMTDHVKSEKKHSVDSLFLDPFHSFPTPQSGAMNSPPKNYDSSMKPNFRTPSGFSNSHIPSPIPTLSSHNTPVRAPSITPDNSKPQVSTDHHTGSLKQIEEYPRIRHKSYSATTAMSYMNIHDAGLIQSTLPEVPSQVEFSTPQLNAIDDLQFKNSGSLLDLATMNVDWNVEQLNLNNPHGINQSTTSGTNQQFYSSLSFSDPNHPHHMKGTTPLTEMMKFDFDNVSMQSKNSNVSAMESTNLKKQKLSPAEEEWVRDIINTPFDNQFPLASHQIGFVQSPNNSVSPESVDEIPGLFKRRQLDLITGLSPSPVISESTIITEDLRSRILIAAQIQDAQFPPLVDLQNYMKLYEQEFDKYFPFVHLPSLKDPMVDNYDNIPLILAMVSIGSLYSFHNVNAISVFNISKLLLHQYFEQKLLSSSDSSRFKKVSISAHQCLVLHIFIIIFLNQDGMADNSARLIGSMARLIYSTGFDKPLESLLVPPQQLIGTAHDPNVIRQNYDYFIMAQSRIKTLHTFYMLQVFRAAVLGQPAPMSADALGSGSYAKDENLWKCTNSTQWFSIISSNNQESITNLSNSWSFSSLLIELHNGYTDLVVPLRTTLSMLFYIHEKIQGSIRHDAMQWRFQERPNLESLLKSWELIYIKAGGILNVNKSNQNILQLHEELKLILPLYYYAKLKLCVNVVPILQSVWSRDWDRMNCEAFPILSKDPEALCEATELAYDIVNVWIHHISVANDAKSTSVRTPVFFVTCVFTAILVIGHFFHEIEGKKSLTAFERSLWLKCEGIIREAENILSGKKNVYLERDNLRLEIQKNGDVNGKVKQVKLACNSLEVGIRILTDAPVWPLAMKFAEALKQKRKYLMQETN